MGEIKIPLTEKEYQILSKAWDKSFETLEAIRFVMKKIFHKIMNHLE